MATTGDRQRANWWLRIALGPLARLLRALGFRWIFWWTVAIPYHPLIPLLFLLVPTGLLVAGTGRVLAGQPPPVSWTSLLATAFLLVIPLSIPIFNIAFLMLRAQFQQGLCFTAAMALLAAEVWTGRSIPILAILPIAYFGTYGVLLARSYRDHAAMKRQDRLVNILGSRILALRWEVTPELDRAPLPRNCPLFEKGKFAGFGLMEAVPTLWVRLDELGPRGAKILALFIKEVGERPMLVAARERFAARGMALPQV